METISAGRSYILSRHITGVKKKPNESVEDAPPFSFFKEDPKDRKKNYCEFVYFFLVTRRRFGRLSEAIGSSGRVYSSDMDALLLCVVVDVEEAPQRTIYVRHI